MYNKRQIIYKTRKLSKTRLLAEDIVVAKTIKPQPAKAPPETSQLNSHKIGRFQKTFRPKLRTILTSSSRVSVALVIVLTMSTPVTIKIIEAFQSRATALRYKLLDNSEELLGKTSPELVKKITYDETKKLYQYNKDAVIDDSNNPDEVAAQLSKQVGKDPIGYRLDLEQDSKKGVTIYDAKSKLSFKLTPQFKTLKGRQIDGRLVYPLTNSGGQLIYTVKENGVKEDVVLPEYVSDELTYDYELELPDSLEARLNSDGTIGIYSADPILFGNISFGSDSDQQSIEKARLNSKKNNLVFLIPAPIIKQTGNNPSSVPSAKFELKDKILSIVSTGLDKATYPLSIDPSVVVTSSSDILKGNFESGVEHDSTNNLIKRTALTGATAQTWTNTTNLLNARHSHSTVTYNGYIYVIGGYTTANQDTVDYAPINSNGTIGTWTNTTSFSNARQAHSSIAYNGYLYVIGGIGASIYNTIQYAPINSNGSLGSWTTSGSTFSPSRYLHSSVAYNNYVYIIGGCTASACLTSTNAVQYALLNADGSVGTWTNNANSISGARRGHTVNVYNGYMYTIGGYTSSPQSDVQFAPINSDGTVGTWASTTSFSNARHRQASIVSGGYLYLLGGCTNGSCTTYTNTVQYAPFNADGTLGVWSATTSFGTSRFYLTAASNNGYIYYLGGCTVDDGAGDCTTNSNTVQYSQINSTGVTGEWVSTTSHTTARYNHGAAVYNDYIYVAGGNGGSNLATVNYAPINSDGTVGTWSATTSFTTARRGLALVAYNGYMYVIGGQGGSYQNDVQYAAINSNGTVGTWNTTTSFTTVRRNHTSFAYNNYLYVIGGYNGSTYQNDVQYAVINSNGTVGTWNTTTSFTTAREAHTTVVANGYAYVIGGTNGTNQNDVQYAAINSNGTIGTWNSTTSFTTARSSHTSVFSKGYVYVMGGYNGAFLNGSQYARINNDGTLTSWTGTVNISSARFGHGSVEYKGNIYVLGGCSSLELVGNSCDGFLSSVTYAPLNNGGVGTTGAWASAGTGFTTERHSHTSIANNGYLYVLGGYDGSVYLDNVRYAPINASGTIGSWSNANSFTGIRSGHATVIYNNYIYVIGGYNGNSYLNTIQYASINSDGSLGTWADGGSNFTTGRNDHSSVAYKDYIYVIGGYNGSALNTVQYAPINSNGTIGSWSSTTNLTSTKYHQESVVLNDYIYVIGGFNGTSAISEVEYAPINSNGTIGSWSPTTSFRTGRYGHNAVISNGFMYVIGGYSTTFLSDIQYAPISSNGTVGEWTNTASFSTARYLMGAATFNGNLYLSGGCSAILVNCSTFHNDVQYAGLKSSPRQSRYSYLVDLTGDARATKLYFRGAVPNKSLVNWRYKSATSSSTVFGSNTQINNALSNVLYTLGASEKRYWQLTLLIDDSASAFFPEVSTNPSTVDDFELYYHPASGNRLRGGKTFNLEVQQSLDAQP